MCQADKEKQGMERERKKRAFRGRVGTMGAAAASIFSLLLQFSFLVPCDEVKRFSGVRENMMIDVKLVIFYNTVYIYWTQ